MSATPSTPSIAVREVALAQARKLARAGQHSEAAQLLASLPDSDRQDVAVCDLMARIHAQQGQLEEADRCWAEVAARSPDHRGATEGRRRIAAIRARTARGVAGRVFAAKVVLRGVAATMAVLVFAMLVDLWRNDRGEIGNDSRDGGGHPVTAPATAAAPSAAPSVSPSPTGDDLLVMLPVAGPGVRVQRHPGELVVTFPDGLFRSGATLSREGRAVLDALGKRLRPYGDRITITVVGHTDRSAVRPGSGYASNAELGTVRATVVREVLRLSAQMPTVRFTVSTLAEELPPYPGSDPRNRTVSLRISAAGTP